MSRVKEVTKYWQQQEASLASMFKRYVPAELMKEELQEITSYLPDLKGKRILELASGVGRYTSFFSSQAESLVSVDLSPHFVAKNRELHADCCNVSFLCADAVDLQFKEHYFDFIFINWLFLYLEDGEVNALLEKLHCWLAPGGRLFFRETCDFTSSKSTKKGYYAVYRPPYFYEKKAREKFSILKDGYIRAYVDHFADPMQCFWLCQKA